MAANKVKQNLRFKQTSQRLHNKVRYDGFTKDEITIIKTQKQLEQVDKELSYFWSKAPRLNNGAVNWDIMTEETLDYFEMITKKQEKLQKKINKLEDKGLNLDYVLNIFMQLNTNSVSF